MHILQYKSAQIYTTAFVQFVHLPIFRAFSAPILHQFHKLAIFVKFRAIFVKSVITKQAFEFLGVLADGSDPL